MSSSIYVPILKWQQAEYQALSRLSKEVKDKIYPLVIIPPVGYDFEERKLKKTIDDHMKPVATRMKAKWGSRPIMVDLHESLRDSHLSNGKPLAEQLLEDLASQKCNAVPVIELKSSTLYSQAIRASVVNGIAIRLSMKDLTSPSLDLEIKNILSSFSLDADMVDLILDLKQPDNFEPYDIFANLLATSLAKISVLQKFRTFAVAGISLKLAEIKKPGALVKRQEWLFYKVLHGKMKGIRVPTYGDYSIEQPEFIQQDMRKMKPAGKIVYTTPENFFVTKGGAFRGNESQMIDHCENVINSGYFKGESFSHGDKRISDTFNKIEGTGNLGVWKQVGISHHLNKVIHQLSSFS